MSYDPKAATDPGTPTIEGKRTKGSKDHLAYPVGQGNGKTIERILVTLIFLLVAAIFVALIIATINSVGTYNTYLPTPVPTPKS